MLNRIWLAGVLGCVGAATAMAAPQPPAHTTRREMKTLMQTAHTPEQFLELHNYFQQKAENFRLLADGQEEEMQRALEHPVGGPKYPSAYDQARHLQMYYRQRAEEATRQAQDYARRIRPSSTRDQAAQ